MTTTETKNAETRAAKANDRVEIYVPRISGNTDPNELIVVNGRNYVLPRGQYSLVPKAVANEWERIKKAQRRVDNAMFEMVEKTRQQAKAAGLK